MHLGAQVEELRARGSLVHTVVPDSDSRAAFGTNLMDVSTRPSVARAGYDRGRAHAEQRAGFWAEADLSLLKAGIPPAHSRAGMGSTLIVVENEQS
jgi:hypothetical protein